MNIINIYEAEAVSVNVPIYVDADPTGTPPEFSITESTAEGPSTFVTGQWDGTYADGKAVAASPLIGGASPLPVVTDSKYLLWCKVLVGAETHVEPVADVRCP